MKKLVLAAGVSVFLTVGSLMPAATPTAAADPPTPTFTCVLEAQAARGRTLEQAQALRRQGYRCVAERPSP
jgi:hypothetical protein